MPKYLAQWLVIALASTGYVYVLVTAVKVASPDYKDVIADVLFSLCSLGLMFAVEDVRKLRSLYTLLLSATVFMFLGYALDTLDEFYSDSWVLDDDVEDILQALGFLLLITGVYLWVGFHKKQNRLLTQLAETDSLTGLLNRRAFIQRANQEIHRVSRVQGEVSVLVFDVDHFKSINDQLGHPYGDYVLQEIAKVTQDVLRVNDFFARFGGEEFIVLVQEAGSLKVPGVAEKIRQAICGHTFSYQGKQHTCSISLGVASLAVPERPAQDTLNKLIEMADTALYKAKSQGRNCVCIAGGEFSC